MFQSHKAKPDMQLGHFLYTVGQPYTETNKKACTWLREFGSVSCLTAVPGSCLA